jgi:DNA-directed RNA polymerase subunit beta
MATSTASTALITERHDFSRIKAAIPIPNLIEVQKNSYVRFLQMDLLPGERDDLGLQSVFSSVRGTTTVAGRAGAHGPGR